MKSLIFSSLFAIFSTTDAFYQLVPLHKETIISWSADIKAGTYLPLPYASQYALEGKIHLQRYNNSIFVKFTNLTHRLHNGISDYIYENETNDVSVLQEVHDLGNVFKITYSEDGLVEEISTKGDEKEFSRNIKKAIASILQLNSSILHKDYHRPESFIVKENSIYGHGNDVYSVFPPSSGKIEVHKLHKMSDDDDIYSYFVTNTEGASCDVKIEKTIIHDSSKNYVLHKSEDFYVVQNISAVGSIGYYPFKAQSDSQIILTNQTFTVVAVVPIVENYQMEKIDYVENTLNYRLSFQIEEEIIFDETSGRRRINYDALMPLVQEMLKDIPQYLREDHINTQDINNKRGQLINRVQQILLKFNVKKLEELQSLLPEDALNALYHILPLVGTEASLIYIKTLIVTKTVDEELAIDLLQNIGGHIRPSVKLVQKLENLIHLNSTYSWNLRKIAILSFGNIIYKSYLQQISLNSVDPQKAFEKYVDEYINNLRNSSSYIVQVTYLLGLRNMKLPILADRLIPAFNGEWWSNQHLRYMAIWAAAPPILFSSGSDKIIETFWPIFTNRHEKVAVRAIAYYYIMYSRPRLSILRNIFTYMLTEPDEELYRIHYTLAQTLVQSTDSCHQDIKLKLAQVMKFSPPPRVGTSEISFFGYQDKEFEYSTGIQEYYLRTEELRIYCYYVTSKLFYNYEEEWVVYWKIHDGRDKDPGLLNSIVDIILNSREEGLDFHIEGSIARRGQIINTYAFDKNSLPELLNFLQFLMTNVPKWSKNLLYINHERYNSYLIPTDLGIPAFWQYLMPELHYNNLTIHKDINGDKFELRVENKYGSWIHYKHGLSFYNPIADVWQGINKYHAYDAVLPLHFNLSLDFKLQKLEVHWQKQDNPQMNVAGFRTHAQQLVFVRNSNETKVLYELLPHGKEFQSVGHGKKYRHNYRFLDEDNLDSGYRLYVANYDSDIHAPYGVFKNRLFQFADPSSKYFHSPLQHWVLVWLNFHRDLVLFPRSGTYGFIARLEPSNKFDVTNIDVAFHQRFDLLGNSSHVPGFDSYSHITYTVKNHDKVLKSWNLNVLIEVASGHNFGSLRLKLRRILPDHNDYNVCIDGYKKWTTKQVNGQWSVTLGESNSRECVNDTVINITSLGRQSREQKSGQYQHRNCYYIVPYSAQYYRSAECIFSHSSLRHYTYEVTSTNVPPQLNRMLTTLGEDVKSFFHPYSSYKSEHNENITKNSFIVNIQFPLEVNEVDVKVATTDQTYRFSGIPLKYWTWFKIAPDSTTYSSAFVEKYENGETDDCTVYSDHRSLNKRFTSEELLSEWTLYVGNNLEHHDYVYLKQMNKKIAIKAIRDKHTVEIIPDAKSELYYIALDGSPLSSVEHQEDWVHWSTFSEGIHKSVAIFLQESGIFINYNVRQVVITIPEGNNWHGQCYAGIVSSTSPSTRNVGTKKKFIQTLMPVTKNLLPLFNTIQKEEVKIKSDSL